jgi:hypothetical protein
MASFMVVDIKLESCLMIVFQPSFQRKKDSWSNLGFLPIRRQVYDGQVLRVPGGYGRKIGLFSGCFSLKV